jgi:hypothetical protein
MKGVTFIVHFFRVGYSFFAFTVEVTVVINNPGLCVWHGDRSPNLMLQSFNDLWAGQSGNASWLSGDAFGVAEFTILATKLISG